jgi:hypothetical protein
MVSEKSPAAARIHAASILLDRGYGKPPQEVSAKVELDYTRLSDADLDELERILTLAELPGPGEEGGGGKRALDS